MKFFYFLCVCVYYERIRDLGSLGVIVLYDTTTGPSPGSDSIGAEQSANNLT